jgi:hypothetical protein
MPLPFYGRTFRPRDYTLYALQALVNLEVVKIHEDGKLCLAEDRWDAISRRK